MKNLPKSSLNGSFGKILNFINIYVAAIQIRRFERPARKTIYSDNKELVSKLKKENKKLKDKINSLSTQIEPQKTEKVVFIDT